MRLGGRLQAAIEVLNDIETHKRPAADALKDWGLAHRFAGSGDRAAIGNIVYDALRQRASITWAMQSDTAHDIAFGALLADGSMDLAAIDEALADDRFAPSTLSKQVRCAWSDADIAKAPDHIRADVPEWCVHPLEALFGNHWIDEAKALSARPPLDLRVNRLKSSRDCVAHELARAHVQEISWFADGLRIPPIEGLGRHPNVQAEAAFQKGWFEVQDLGSQIAAHLANAQPGQHVLDYCAGAGGKTMALAADMENQGQIHAYDIEKTRLAPIFDRLKRAGVQNAQIHGHSDTLGPLKGHMDLVLVDAPCTGSGTWRRRPDAKWRLTQAQLERREEEQRDVLEKASYFVKPGGRLIYITCSLFSNENDAQISAFVAQHPEFRANDSQALWSNRMNPCAPSALFGPWGTVLSPAKTDTDGFFVSVLEKAV